MAQLGGYLAVSYVAESVFTGALETLWRTEWEEAGATGDWSANTPFGALTASGAVSIEKPAMAFRGAANAIEVRIAGGARAEISLDGLHAGGVFVDFDATVSLRINVTDEGGLSKAVVDLTGFTLDAAAMRLTWFDPPNFANAEPAVLSAEAREALSDQVRKRAARYLTFRLPTDKLFLAELMLMTQGVPGSILVTPLIRLGNVRILDGWFALGIDATSGVGATNGNAEGIGPPPDAPPLGPAPMAQLEPGLGTARLIVDPALATTYMQANAKFAVIMQVGSRPNLHPNLDGIGVSFENGTVVVNVNGMVDAPDPFPGQMPFTATVRIQPFLPKNTHTVYASVKPDVRVDAPWYLDVLGAIIDFFGGDVFEKLRRANKSDTAILFGVMAGPIEVPEAFGAYAQLEGRQLVIQPDLVGFYGEASVWTTFSTPNRDPTPEFIVPVPIRDRILRLRLVNRRLAADPTFFIRYRILRGSNGEQLGAGVFWSGSDQAFNQSIDMWEPEHVLETRYDIALTIERPPGAVVASVVLPAVVIDPLDRSHPFVRWRKTHYWPGGGGGPTTIASAVHRTAIPGRCLFCDVREGRFGTPYEMQALDSLPAPEEEGFSTRLCAYCFPDA